MILYLTIGTFALIFLSSGCAQAAISAGMLIKGSSATVYYVNKENKRYVFPNAATFASWYPDAKTPVIRATDAEIATLPLAGNVTMRPGANLVKIQTDPKVYAVGAGGYLYWVGSESIAKSLYGADWNKKIVDVPDVFFVNYKIDTPIQNAAAYNRNDAMKYTDSIQTDLDARNNHKADKWMSADQKRVMNILTNLFESGEQYPSYSLVEFLDDGRGYTSGRAGFTTATGDAYMVAKRYALSRPGNILNEYLPELQNLADGESDDVSGLDGYVEAWQKAALDPLFRQAQDEVAEELYYFPAMREADALGVKTALAKAFMFDTMIQHGGGNDPDSFGAIIESTTGEAGGSPKSGIDENIWFAIMLDVRQGVLLDAHEPATREVWRESAYRVDVYKKLLSDGNVDLSTPFVIQEKWIDEVVR